MITITYLVFSESSLGKTLDKRFSERIQKEKDLHVQGNKLRKQFHKNIGSILQELAVDTGSNRAITFEFSNGTSNLVGLPFLYMSVVAEVMSPGLEPMMSKHQRMNIATISEFLITLEEKGYIFIPDFDNLDEEFGLMTHFFGNKNVKSALFYSLEGVAETIGFVVILTTKKSNKILNLPQALTEIARTAQKVSALINFPEWSKRSDDSEKKNKFK
ncbi:MAG: hypothetical protein ACOH2V_00280 [Candidatus Saccharimonadaceae bacterium]